MDHDLRTGVYAIALNEELHVRRWADTTRDAYYRLIVDTGSTDQTVALAHQHGIAVSRVIVKPWRFDDARNAALGMMPANLDIVIALDLDEVLVPNWRAELLSVWTPTTTRLKYLFKSVTDDHVSHTYQERITARFGNRWKYAAHETLVSTVPPVITVYDGILVEHRPDRTKPRNYLPLLELAVMEDPYCERSAHLLGREYFFRRRWQDAITQLERHLGLSRARWKPERAASMRYIAKCHAAMDQFTEANAWMLRAIVEDTSKETLLDCAKFCFDRTAYHACIGYCEQALAIKTADKHHYIERYAQNEGPYDVMSLAYVCLGDYDHAIDCVQQASRINPSDLRLKKTLKALKDAK